MEVHRWEFDICLEVACKKEGDYVEGILTSLLG